MAYENGWKDGWSSADHAEQSYSPYAWERARREAGSGIYDEEKPKKTYMTEYEKAQNQREWEQAKFEREVREHSENRRQAINYIVQEKRDEYNKKSWLGKAFAKMRGKDFQSLRSKIRAEAEQRVDKMSDDQLERFVERHIESEGRTR